MPAHTNDNGGEPIREDVENELSPESKAENAEEVDHYDHEFAPSNNPSKTKDDNEGINANVSPKSEKKEVEQEHDEGCDDDDVTNFNGVYEIVMDVSIPERPTPERLNSLGLPISSMNPDSNDCIDVQDNKANSSSRNCPRSNQPSCNVNLNPDLDEGKKVLRRMGSFTG